MLKLLAEYAEKHGIDTEAGFEPKDVRWILNFSPDGRFLGVLPAQTQQEDNPNREFKKCPALTQPEMVSNHILSHFLVDTVDRVALFKVKATDETTHERHAYFVNLLREASAAMPELGLVADCLSDKSALAEMQRELENQGAQPADKVTFQVGDEFLVDSDRWRDWWRGFRRKFAAEEFAKKSKKKQKELQAKRCDFLTGEVVQPAPTHPKIKGLGGVGGRPSGDALVGFDKDAFQSYGLEQSANAAVSEESAWAYRNSLNYLLKHHSQRLAGARVVHWFKEKVSSEDDPHIFLEEPPETEELNAQELVRRLLTAIRSGERPDLADNYFYALTLSGASGRVMIRDWMEGQFKELVTNVKTWFEDLQMINYSGSKDAKTPGIERVVTCLLEPRKRSQKYEDWIKPVGAARISLWRSAVCAEPIPYHVLCRLVLLDRNFRLSGKFEEVTQERNHRDFAATMSLLYARMGLMKAYLLRKNRKEGGEVMSQDLRPYLNEEHPSAAYHCGRLMAVLAGLQHAALGDVGAGVVQRYYAAASSTPALVLGRLIRTSQFHLNKLEGGLPYYYEGKIGGIMGRLRDTIPTTLSLEGQSLFALGYYQQLADLRTKKSHNLSEGEVENNE